MKNWIRWAAVVPSAIIAWYLAFVLSIFAVAAVGSICPSAAKVSGMCTAPWYLPVERAVTLGGIGMSAVFVVAAASWVAPSHRRAVAWVAFALGAVVALLMGREFGGDASAQVGSALIGGVVAAVLISVFLRKRHDT